MREHDLKTWPQFFDVIERGIKTFEIRQHEDGRHFSVGDTLRLREWNPQRQDYTGREALRTVTYITKWEQKRGFVVMAIVPYCVRQSASRAEAFSCRAIFGECRAPRA